MIYLESFTLPDSGTEEAYLEQFAKRTCYDSYYPFQVFYNRDMPRLEFEDITIFYGGNGSGKSTLLNVIAEKLQLQRRERIPVLHLKDPGECPLHIGRAGEQSFPEVAEGTEAVYHGLHAELPLPVHHCDPLAFHAVHSARPDL